MSRAAEANIASPGFDWIIYTANEVLFECSARERYIIPEKCIWV
jgi:hypothetical protein